MDIRLLLDEGLWPRETALRLLIGKRAVERFRERLRRRGDLVVCDNLSTHKVAGARELVESAGAQLVCLPPYSPDLNPIEKAFSKLKADLRDRAARSFEELLDATAKALEGFTSQHCANFFKSCNYVT